MVEASVLPWPEAFTPFERADGALQAREILRLKSDLNAILARHTGRTIEEIEHDTNRDYYMDAKTAVEYGVVDHVMDMPIAKQIMVPNVK